ncbi:helix-turn-helix domain-containing protein [Auraticoccus monumenti]|uniref:Sugar-specific transcriptional regulator TrmB n=1 Tax=Auraticoccus monumenti TaxID=675864 RepID=A0A1G6WKN8_9ACTN|nr:helix-turn-helix domain-containing protein [Auraticoccus monumenti]SDD66520.1 Sugar-specific transcriptional regulator TrmB [Auraticoccus monumenti]
MLQSLGISPQAESLYSLLAPVPSARPDDLTAGSGLRPEHVAAGLAELGGLGLVSLLPDGAYRALPLGMVVTALRQARQHELDAAVLAAESFERQITAARLSADENGIVSLVGREAMQAASADLCDRAEHEVCILDQPPYATDVSPHEDAAEMEQESPEFRALRRGVRMRTVYHPGFDERRLAVMNEFAAQGEEARIGRVPLKMLLIDGTYAMIPTMSSYVEDGPVRASVLNNQALVEALQWLFERAWEAALPAFSDSADHGGRDRTEHLIQLLMSGSTDSAIAGQLGVSERSVRRWVSELMDQHRVRTRLQLGAALVRAGTLAP